VTEDGYGGKLVIKARKLWWTGTVAKCRHGAGGISTELVVRFGSGRKIRIYTPCSQIWIRRHLSKCLRSMPGTNLISRSNTKEITYKQNQCCYKKRVVTRLCEKQWTIADKERLISCFAHGGCCVKLILLRCVFLRSHMPHVYMSNIPNRIRPLRFMDPMVKPKYAR